MKRRYSPEARRAHLAHMRAKYGKSSVVSVREVATLPTLPVDEVVRQGLALIDSYHQGFLTMLELGQSLNELFAREQPKPEEDDDGLPLPAPKHADDCRCHLCWAASLTPPSPPWEGGAA